MEAKELRLGNWVIDTDGTFCQISCGSDIEGLWKPIPLTPEILEKAGLQEDSDYKGVWSDKKAGFSICQMKDGSFNIMINLEYTIIDNIKYLHQFQNIHFAFTGEELQIEL